MMEINTQRKHKHVVYVDSQACCEGLTLKPFEMILLGDSSSLRSGDEAFFYRGSWSWSYLIQQA